MADPWDELVDDPECTEGDDDGDHSVPAELLDLHEQLEAAGVTPEDFKKAYGGGREVR